MKLVHAQVGEKEPNHDPELTWSRAKGAKQYILLCEDVDHRNGHTSRLVLRDPGEHHGSYSGRHGSRVEGKDRGAENGNGLMSKGEFWYLKDLRRSHYGGPRPPRDTDPIDTSINWSL